MGPHEVSRILFLLIKFVYRCCRNFHVHNPPPLEWSMDEKSLLPLIIVEDSDEEDNQDSHGLVDKSSGPSLRHTASVFFVASMSIEGVLICLQGAPG